MAGFRGQSPSVDRAQAGRATLPDRSCSCAGFLRLRLRPRRRSPGSRDALTLPGNLRLYDDAFAD